MTWKHWTNVLLDVSLGVSTCKIWALGKHNLKVPGNVRSKEVVLQTNETYVLYKVVVPDDVSLRKHCDAVKLIVLFRIQTGRSQLTTTWSWPVTLTRATQRAVPSRPRPDPTGLFPHLGSLKLRQDPPTPATMAEINCVYEACYIRCVLYPNPNVALIVRGGDFLRQRACIDFILRVRNPGWATRAKFETAPRGKGGNVNFYLKTRCILMINLLWFLSSFGLVFPEGFVVKGGHT